MKNNLYERVSKDINPFSVRVTSSRYPTTNSHWHEHLEMKYFLGGVTRSTICDKEYTALDGEILLANPYELHSFTTVGKLDNIVVLISPDFYSDMDMSNIIFEHHIKNDTFLQEQIKKIYDLSDEDTISAKFKIKATVNIIMEHLVTCHTLERLNSKEANSRIMLSRKISETLNYIENNYTHKITIPDLLEVSHFSEGYFTRIFKEATGKTPINYINEYRLLIASGLLKTTAMTVTQIASSVGFDDVNYFTRLFKRTFSAAPNEYRKL